MKRTYLLASMNIALLSISGIAQEKADTRPIVVTSSTISYPMPMLMRIAYEPLPLVAKSDLCTIRVDIKNISNKNESVCVEGQHTLSLYIVTNDRKLKKVLPKSERYDGSGGAEILSPGESSHYDIFVPKDVLLRNGEKVAVSLQMASEDFPDWQDVFSPPFAFGSTP
jgi:hypothetical protein